MKLFQKLINLAKQLLLMQTKYHLHGKEINLTADNTTIKSTNFSVDKNGNMSCSNANITGGKLVLYSEDGSGQPSIKIINPKQTSTYTEISSGRMLGYGDGSLATQFYYLMGILTLKSDNGMSTTHSGGLSSYKDSSNESTIAIDANGGTIRCKTLTQTSTKSKKKNIKKLDVNAIDLIKNADICLYNLKGEKAKSKKHIGLVIGEGYNCPNEVVSEDEQGVEQYSMTSIAWKAIQELIEENKNLKARLDRLEENNDKLDR